MGDSAQQPFCYEYVPEVQRNWGTVCTYIVGSMLVWVGDW